MLDDDRSASAALLVSMALCLPAAALADDETAAAAVVNVDQMKFEPTPGLPSCAVNAVLSGDPTKGPSIILGKVETGCIVPWHWHTSNERLMLVTGIAELAMQGGRQNRLQGGGFAMMPTRHIHQFRCVESCLMYVYSDGIFDIHYVDHRGNEIPAGAALQAGGETAVPLPE